MVVGNSLQAKHGLKHSHPSVMFAVALLRAVLL